MSGVFRIEKADNDGFVTIIMEDRINNKRWIKRIRADDRESIKNLRKRFFSYIRKEGNKL